MRIVFERGDVADCEHDVGYAIVDAKGSLLAGAMPEKRVYLRSAAKMMQALPLVMTSAHRQFKLTERHLALACSSHIGAGYHIEIVDDWLERLGIDDSELVCGISPPTDKNAAADLIRRGIEFSQKYHMCSGKHLGMISVCRHKGWPLKGYHHRDHPLQQSIFGIIAELCEVEPGYRPALDGCNVPCLALSLADWAKGLARFSLKGERWSEAGSILQQAQLRHPELIHGTGKTCSRLTLAGKGSIIVKSGADGVMVAVFPRRNIALTLKVRSGSSLAAKNALLILLSAMDALPESELAISPVKTLSGIRAGRVYCSEFDASELRGIAN